MRGRLEFVSSTFLGDDFLTEHPRIIRSNHELRSSYSQLEKDDVICSRISLHPGEEGLLTDLVERGVHLIPSGTSQLLSKSKVLQVQMLGEFMIHHSLGVFTTHDLLAATTYFNKENINKVVLKLDRKNGGQGVFLFESIESLYNHVCGGIFQFPIVIQPLIPNARDIRVIIIGDYIEAYERSNPHNFRNNLHCGGAAQTYELTKSQTELCKKIMKRGAFPYAHLDLILFGETGCRLMEINLRGGLRGAKLIGREYETRTQAVHNDLLRQHLASVSHT